MQTCVNDKDMNYDTKQVYKRSRCAKYEVYLFIVIEFFLANSHRNLNSDLRLFCIDQNIIHDFGVYE